MKTLASTLALIAALSLSGAALARTSGGSDAKGNAPLKAVHTVNDGTAKRGASSFTEGQARQRILNSGYSSVSGLVKGADGVWRGAAMRAGATIDIAMDFKGNVSEAAPAPVAPSSSAQLRTTTTHVSAPTRPEEDTAAAARRGVAARHRHHRKHGRRYWARHHSHCVNPRLNGVACSGIDRDKNGISDKEDRALTH